MKGENWRAVRTIARHEFRAGLRGRMVPVFAFLFAALTIGITLAGLAASGQLLVQDFSRSAVSILTLAVYVIPLIGLILGASATGGEDGGTELLLSQPLSRTTALVGRTFGLVLCLLLIVWSGFGATAIIIASATGVAGLGGFLVVAASTTLLGIAALNLGVLIGVLVRRRATAVGWALGFWFCAAVLYDVAAIMVLQTTGNGNPGPGLIALLALNPIDGVRVLGMVELGADILLGPAGSALQRALGDMSPVLLWGSVMFWAMLPMIVAGRVHARRDF
jgi:Cu-processing system permease protein